MPPPLQPKPPTAGTAIASLVLALAGILCIFTPIAGLICGIIALVKIKRSQGALGGRGIAIAGIVISVILLLLLPAFLNSGMSVAVETAKRSRCINNLRQISQAAHTVALTNDLRLPATFEEMRPHLGTPRILACPFSTVLITEGRLDQFDFNKITYEIAAPGAKADDAQTIYLRCPDCSNYAQANGHIVRVTLRKPAQPAKP